jgi:hypothetical protein
MSQYQTGTVSVANGSNVVTGSGTAWDVNVTAGDLFKVSGESAIYEIASVDSATQITLTANYAGATNTGLSYAIIRDFTTYYSLPKLAQGDIDLQDIFNRAVNKIDQYLGFRKSFHFFQDNVAASQTAVILSDGVSGRGPISVRPGSILAIGVRSSEARTAGTLTVEVYKNGAATGLTAVLDATNTTVKVTTQARDTDTFIAGDQIAARVTTDASWAPTTADIDVTVEIEEDEDS